MRMADISAVKFNPVPDGSEVLKVAGREVIQYAHEFTAPDQLLHHMRTNEPRASCYQIKGQPPPPEFRTTKFITNRMRLESGIGMPESSAGNSEMQMGVLAANTATSLTGRASQSLLVPEPGET
jgi:hypothetical protein